AIEFRLRELQVRARLLRVGFVDGRIEPDQRRAPGDALALVEEDRVDASRHFRPHRDRLVGAETAHRSDRLRQRSRHDLDRLHGDARRDGRRRFGLCVRNRAGTGYRRASALLAVPSPARAQIYPTKSVRLIVPFPPGGSLDFAGRLIAQKLTEAWDQPVVVENKPGAGGNIGADLVAKSPPDGYTILLGALSTHAVNPSLYAKMPYDAVKDFVPITLIAV